MAPATAYVAHAASLSRTIALVILTGLLASLFPAPVYAQSQSTGTIQGVVVDDAGKPVAGVAVSIAAPSASYKATTDAKGFFAVAGVTPDTYVVSFAKTGFASQYVEGVTIVPGQAATVSPHLGSILKTIGRTTGRSPGSAYNPSASSDTYTVTESQVNQLIGTENNTNEANLLASLPGVSIDASGYPVLRGGRENEEGFQFEGIPYTDAFTTQFTNSLTLIGTRELQLTPGSGDASVGNAGTGAINLIAKRGSYPGNGEITYEFGGPGVNEQYFLNYGIATPDNKFSNYVSYEYENAVSVEGVGQQSPLLTNNYFSENGYQNVDFIDNFVYKFGPSQNQSLQLFVNSQYANFYFNKGGNVGLNFPTGDPAFLATNEAFTGLSGAQLQALEPFYYQQTAAQEALSKAAEQQFQPNGAFKIQYSWNVDPTTFLTAKYFKTNAVSPFDYAYLGSETSTLTFFLPGEHAIQGGQQTGVAIDGQKQFGEKNLVTFGLGDQFLHPVDAVNFPNAGTFLILNGLSLYDFVSQGTCPLTGGPATYGGVGTCGYLASQGLPNAKFPIPELAATYFNRQVYDAYISDAYSPSTKLKITAGVRDDRANTIAPNCTIYTCLPSSTTTDAAGNSTYTFDENGNAYRDPTVFQPRLSINYSITNRDAIRLQYGRSVQFSPIADNEDQQNPAYFNYLSKVPAYSNTGGSTATCGVTGNQPCANYGQQTYWFFQNTLWGVPVQLTKPAVFTNYEGSYSHDFGHDLSVKVTPFYRDSTNDVASVAQPLTLNGKVITNSAGAIQYGPPTATNLGLNKSTGVEFYMTQGNTRPSGFSAILSATYINELSNVIPTSSSEDFFPSIPTQSLALGNVYRVGFLSPLSGALSLQYKTKDGFQITPIFRYAHGYPYGQGLYTAYYVGATAENVPNTNVTDSNGASAATTYIDPENPGTLQNPHRVATRGTGESASAGGLLTQSLIHSDINLQYTSKKIHGIIGLFVQNVFNNTYGTPRINEFYQPVATGIAGPQTGVTGLAGLGPQYANEFGFGGNEPYLLGQYNQPLTFNLYYTLKI